MSALNSWLDARMRGIVAAATGTGKTRMAQAAIRAFWTPGARVVIVVPSVNLQRQWIKTLCTAFGLVDTQIGRLGGQASLIHEGHGFVVAVINSARTGLRALNAGWREEGRRVMLIVDECHWAATSSNAGIFADAYDATLGLSATPERSDDGLDEVLIPQLGPLVFRYSIREALDDNVLAPLRVVNYYFDLDSRTMEELEPLQISIERLETLLEDRLPHLKEIRGLERTAALLRASMSMTATRGLRDLYQRRGLLLEGADARRMALREIAESGLFAREPCIVFHERIDEARRTAAMLDSLGCRWALELSTDDQRRRDEAIRDFRSGIAKALVAVRTLDEGVDLPEAKLAVIVAGGHSIRQRLQRIGRVLRPTGQRATVVSLLARKTAEEFEVGDNDPWLLGHQRVVRVSSAAALIGKVADSPNGLSLSEPTLG